MAQSEDAVFFQEGASIDYTPAADVVAGKVVVQNGLIGITRVPILANALGSLAIEGVFKAFKQDAKVVAVGTRMFWDEGPTVGNTGITGESSGNQFFGPAVLASAAAEDFVKTRLANADRGPTG